VLITNLVKGEGKMIIFTSLEIIVVIKAIIKGGK